MAIDYLEPAYKRAIVTGGGSGIGRAVTLALADRGVDVLIIGRREDKLAETCQLASGLVGKVEWRSCDIRDLPAIERAFAVGGGDPVPMLVHAAAEVHPCAAERLTADIFNAAVSSQLVGAFNVFHGWARPLIRAKKPGVLLVYTSSHCGRETPGLSHSSATKAGVEGLIRTWAVELGRLGLRLNAIGPGLFPLDDTLHMRDGFFDEGMFKDNIPLGRFGVVEEIVGPSLFMLSKSASYVTGEILHVDGGVRLRPRFGFSEESLLAYGEEA